MSRTDWRLAVVVGITLLLMLALGFATGATIARGSADGAMWELVDGYDTCLSAPGRTTDCVLEYDGDGSSNTPADWHWYWR